jgi:Protein of unknown function (DUF5672)
VIFLNKYLTMKPLVAIVIPIYQQELSNSERISLQQCCKILGNYPIIFVKNEELNTDYLKEFHPKPRYEYFEPSYFESTKSYNTLLLNPEFYSRFDVYQYIFVYQLDGFVFRDELKEWCKRDFDYIGSPIIRDRDWLDFKENKTDRWYLKPELWLMNGGVSLRKVAALKRFLKIYHKLYPTWPANEDTLFSIYHWRALPLKLFLKLPSWQEALPFGFEQKLQQCLAITNGKAPFVCHAWEKYDISFWRPFFKEQGIEI